MMVHYTFIAVYINHHKLLVIPSESGTGKQPSWWFHSFNCESKCVIFIFILQGLTQTSFFLFISPSIGLRLSKIIDIIPDTVYPVWISVLPWCLFRQVSKYLQYGYTDLKYYACPMNQFRHVTVFGMYLNFRVFARIEYMAVRIWTLVGL